VTVLVSAHDVAFLLAVVGAAMIFPPLALLVGAAWLVVLVVIGERRTAAPVVAEPEPGPEQPREYGPGVVG
jgi:hypothetical protein